MLRRNLCKLSLPTRIPSQLRFVTRRIEIAMKEKTCHQGRLPVFHVANPRLTSWLDILDGLHHAGLQFSTVPPSEWVANVRRSPGDAEADPTKGMLSMWDTAVSQA